MRAALSAGWGLDASAVTLQRDHWNTVYRIRAGDHRYALRRHSPIYHHTPALESELLWLSALASELPGRVPEPVPTTRGDLVHRRRLARAETVAGLRRATEPLDTHERWTLLRWVDGRAPGRVGPRTLESWGRLLARLHHHADGWEPPARFRRPTIDVPSLGRSWFQPHDESCWTGVPDDVTRVFRSTLERAAALEADLHELAPELFGLVHADLHRGNVLRTPSGLAAIDFDDCAHACRLYDFAVVLAGEQRTPRDAHGRALLRGYRQLHPLDSGLLPALEVFVACRTVAVALFINDWAQDHPAMRPRVRPAQRAAVALLADLHVA